MGYAYASEIISLLDQLAGLFIVTDYGYMRNNRIIHSYVNERVRWRHNDESARAGVASHQYYLQAKSLISSGNLMTAHSMRLIGNMITEKQNLFRWIYAGLNGYCGNWNDPSSPRSGICPDSPFVVPSEGSYISYSGIYNGLVATINNFRNFASKRSNFPDKYNPSFGNKSSGGRYGRDN